MTTPAHARPALLDRFGPQPDDATRRDILALREAAWWAWFQNDREAFLRIVPDELLALGWMGAPWEDRDTALARMSEFAATGTRLTKLEFPVNVFQHYGDVILLYTRFLATLAAPDGGEQTVSGRGTEVFVRRNGAWAHTAWHLDAVPAQAPELG